MKKEEESGKKEEEEKLNFERNFNFWNLRWEENFSKHFEITD